MIHKLQKTGLIPRIIRGVSKSTIPESSASRILTYSPSLIKYPKTMKALYNLGLDDWVTSGYHDVLGEKITLDPVFTAGLHLPQVKSIIGERPLFFWRAESPLGKPQLKTYHGALFGSTLRNASTYVKPFNFDILRKDPNAFKEMRYNLSADNVFDYYPNFVEMIKAKRVAPNENALGLYVTNGDNIRVLDAEKASWSGLKGHFPEIELEYKDLFGNKIPEQSIRKWNNPERRFTTDNIAKLATKTGTTFVIKNVGDPGYYSLMEDPGRYTTEIIVPLGQPVKSVLNSSFNWSPKETGSVFKIFKQGGKIK